MGSKLHVSNGAHRKKLDDAMLSARKELADFNKLFAGYAKLHDPALVDAQRIFREFCALTKEIKRRAAEAKNTIDEIPHKFVPRSN